VGGPLSDCRNFLRGSEFVGGGGGSKLDSHRQEGGVVSPSLWEKGKLTSPRKGGKASLSDIRLISEGGKVLFPSPGRRAQRTF